MTYTVITSAGKIFRHVTEEAIEYQRKVKAFGTELYAARDAFADKLRAKLIGTGTFYPSSEDMQNAVEEYKNYCAEHEAEFDTLMNMAQLTLWDWDYDFRVIEEKEDEKFFKEMKI